ncbi:hypothetical protein VTK56DRAFT_234 [Thermocarpiscus australiensis]
MTSNATIKAIDSSTVHQIQSGQVIVDLCSVAKELVENSIDAGATAIEVRFKNQGLDSIEVQDNGSGIAPHNYESVALKHYTSKLSSYDDLSTLHTFGFRGEALSSLCALSRFSIVTCTQQEAPRATRLEFETSGRLKSTSVVSGQRGTTVFVEDLFRNLPVRRRELERNIKREWGKVISLLNQYACVQCGIKFTVSQQPTKGKRMVLFSTKGNPTTRENIINVFGVKTMNALIAMDLKLELVPTTGPLAKGKARGDGSATEVRVLGHVSRPTHGEGRQTPDRQMFYVNGRPCALPQFAKVFNEVYRSYNASQSPFIFADIQLDTRLYDVNVSPDKRTILLHDQGQMLDNLRESLIELFETQDVTIPVSQAAALKQTPFIKASALVRTDIPSSPQDRSNRVAAAESQHRSEACSSARRRPISEERVVEAEGGEAGRDGASEAEEEDDGSHIPTKVQITHNPAGSLKSTALLSRWLNKNPDSECPHTTDSDGQERAKHVSNDTLPSSSAVTGEKQPQGSSVVEEQISPGEDVTGEPDGYQSPPVTDFHARFAKAGDKSKPGLGERGSQEPGADRNEREPPVLAIAPPSQPAPPRFGATASTRPFKRPAQEVATITIGDHTVTSVIGNAAKRLRGDEISKAAKPSGISREGRRGAILPSFGGRLSQLFSASAHPDEEHVSDTQVATEDVDVEDVETAPEGDDDEDSLFVPQVEDVETGSGDDEETNGLQKQKPPSIQTEEDSEVASDADSPLKSVAHSPSCHGDHAAEHDEYMGEDEKKAQEDKKVHEMIVAAETAAAAPIEDGEKRSQMFLKGRPKRKDMTLNLLHQVKTSEGEIRERMMALADRLPKPQSKTAAGESAGGLEADDAEERLSLKISKSDFAKMRIIGQFNLGFILAVREAGPRSASPSAPSPSAEGSPREPEADDELFIIDQHASDEKYNFERLQATTTVQSQRLVQPKTLELTALEEEIVLEHLPALERNGFLVQVDTTGAKPVGSRCQLLSLPLSRETTFSLTDLEELVFLLGDNPTSSAATVPRPSKVRKMFAMRACRSSIMVGRALSRRQMEKVVRHMGEMEKPWNCPHGRPTMRHLCGLSAWDERMWEEGDGFYEREGRRTDWAGWVRQKKGED